MSTEIKMPEPTAWMLAVQTMGGDIGWKLSWSQSGAGVCNRLSGESNEKPLITTDQAEAYANARVREALEAAYHEIVDLHQSLLGDGVPASIQPAQIANIAANRISAMIPKETT